MEQVDVHNGEEVALSVATYNLLHPKHAVFFFGEMRKEITGKQKFDQRKGRAMWFGWWVLSGMAPSRWLPLACDPKDISLGLAPSPLGFPKKSRYEKSFSGVL